jgi:hypothetical protein
MPPDINAARLGPALAVCVGEATGGSCVGDLKGGDPGGGARTGSGAADDLRPGRGLKIVASLGVNGSSGVCVIDQLRIAQSSMASPGNSPD